MIKITAIAIPFATLLSISLHAALPVPENLNALFLQTVSNHENNRSLNYEGKVWIKLPKQAKWIYEKPVKKIICVTKDRAWVIEPELEQATLFRLQKAIPLMQILQNAKRISKGHYRAEYGGVAYRIDVDDKKRLKSISYEDDLGNMVTISFRNIDNSPIDEKVLQCDIPQDYDIIDSRY
ncbi:LolA-like outer membrane lipoprotein chaperone [Hydrogenimonas sp.]